MTKAQIAAALGALFTGVAVGGAWFAPGDGSPAKIEITSYGNAQLGATAQTAITSWATQCGAQGPLTVKATRDGRTGTVALFVSDGGTCGFPLTAAQQTAFVGYVRERFPTANADSVVLISSSTGETYDTVTLLGE